MKPNEIRALTVKEIEQKINIFRKELFNLRIQSATGEIQNPLRRRTVKKIVARALTIKGEKEREESSKG